MRKRMICVFALLVSCSIVAAEEGFAPFVIPAVVNPDSAIAYPYKPLDETSRLTAREGHFYDGQGQRVRLWGVNLSFGANFPTHEDAPQVAERLAAAGVNVARLHHMDSANWPSGIWDPNTGQNIYPEALDRLGFFIDQLALHGIYVNMNLHVGRKHSQYRGLPDSGQDMDKKVTIFTPALIAAQKDYARQLLGYENPYRHMRFAEDPAVAMVEITNEDSLFLWDAEETLPWLPDYYANLLRELYNQWLKQRYGTTAKVQEAWSAGSEPLGDNLLKNGELEKPETDGQSPNGWFLEQHAGAKANVAWIQWQGQDALSLEPVQISTVGWHLQFNQRQLPVKQGRAYTLTFEAAAPQPRPIHVSLGQGHPPWKGLGFYKRIKLGTDWKTHRFSFVMQEDDENARLNFEFGDQDGAVYLRHIVLQPGASYELAASETLETGTVLVYGDNESTARFLDRMQFFTETEKRFFDGMRSYLRNELGCQALVTGTIVFGPLGLYAQSDMDFIDAHSYWQHPQFPGRPWDPENWLIEQKPMADYKEQATLWELAVSKLAGKPFTVTEYNHPAPLDSQAECVPIIASFGAGQDWDGIWIYSYSHNQNWDQQSLNGFFDIDTNPAKWGFMRAGAAIFRDGGIAPLPAATLDLPQNFADLAASQQKYNRSLLFLVKEPVLSLLENRVELTMGSLPQDPSKPEQDSPFNWTSDSNGKGLYQVRGEKIWVGVGHTGRFSENTDPVISLDHPKFAAITITALDHRSLQTSTKMLITACGRCENTDMAFREDRRTVGRDWGHGPVRIETVTGSVKLPAGLWKGYALAPDGTILMEVPIENGLLNLDGKYKTMWYFLRSDGS